MSKPCKRCIKLIKQAGIRKVYYSVDNGVVVINAKYIKSDHLSFGQKMLAKENNTQRSRYM